MLAAGPAMSGPGPAPSSSLGSGRVGSGVFGSRQRFGFGDAEPDLAALSFCCPLGNRETSSRYVDKVCSAMRSV